MAENEQIRHSTEDVYRRLSSVEADVAGLKSDIKNIADAVVRIETRVNQPQTPFNYLGVAGLFFVVMSFMGAIGLATLSPVNDDTLHNHERLHVHAAEIQHLTADAASTNARLDNLERNNSGIEENRVALGRIEGEIEVMRKVVDDIDRGGSRRWVDRK